MADQSHREEMSAAIRAQRERQAVPRSLAPAEDEPEARVEQTPDEQEPPEGFLSRLFGR